MRKEQQLFLESLASVIMVTKSDFTDDRSLAILADMRHQYVDPSSETKEQILQCLNRTATTKDHDSLTNPLHNWLIGPYIKLGLHHQKNAFVHCRINLGGNLDPQNLDNSFDILFPELEDNFKVPLRASEMLSITFDTNRSHWITIFIHPESKQVILFDPYGTQSKALKVSEILDQGEAQLRKAIGSKQAIKTMQSECEQILGTNYFGFLMKVSKAGLINDFKDYTLSWTGKKYQEDYRSCGQWSILFSDFMHSKFQPSDKKTIDDQFTSYLKEKIKASTKLPSYAFDEQVRNVAENLMHNNLKAIIDEKKIKTDPLHIKTRPHYKNHILIMSTAILILATLILFPNPIYIALIAMITLISVFYLHSHQLMPNLMVHHSFYTSNQLTPCSSHQISKVSGPQVDPKTNPDFDHDEVKKLGKPY